MNWRRKMSSRCTIWVLRNYSPSGFPNTKYIISFWVCHVLFLCSRSELSNVSYCCQRRFCLEPYCNNHMQWNWFVYVFILNDLKYVFSENCICRLMQWSCWNRGAVDAACKFTCHRRQLLFVIHSFSMCLLMLIIGGLVWFGGSLRTELVLKLLVVRHVCSVFVWLMAAVSAMGVLVQVSVLLFLQLIFRTLLLTMFKA